MGLSKPHKATSGQYTVRGDQTEDGKRKELTVSCCKGTLVHSVVPSFPSRREDTEETSPRANPGRSAFYSAEKTRDRGGGPTARGPKDFGLLSSQPFSIYRFYTTSSSSKSYYKTWPSA